MMDNGSISQKIHSTFDGRKRSKNLPGLCLELLSEQKKEWPQLREGCESLGVVREREIDCGRFPVRLQHNPGRIRSSLAVVEEKNRNHPPCFLCPDQLPQPQKGILYGGHYLILCNPMPIFPSHFTLSHVQHRNQALLQDLDTFLGLMIDFGSGWTLLYNGPRCGASAPDHLHFQAVPSGQMPIEQAIREEERLALAMEGGGVSLYRLRDMGREVILLEGNDPMAMEKIFNSFLNALKRILSTGEEPMINVAGYYGEGKSRLIIFPRRKHRPDAFFSEGKERVVISPGVIDMGGVLVTPAEKDFERLNRDSIEAIYREVSLEGNIMEKVIDAMANGPVILKTI